MTNQELLSGWLKMSGKNKEIGWPQFVGRMVEIFGMEGPFSNQPMWVFLRTKSPFERRKCSKNSTFDAGHKGRNPMTLGTDLWYGVIRSPSFFSWTMLNGWVEVNFGKSDHFKCDDDSGLNDCLPGLNISNKVSSRLMEVIVNSWSCRHRRAVSEEMDGAWRFESSR